MVAPAFADTVLASQATFRAVLTATARPGTVVPLSEQIAAPPPLSSGAAVIALTLCDHGTPIWLDAGLRTSPAVVEWLRFHTGARIVENPGLAAFALVSAPRDVPSFEHFNAGTLEYPDRSTTIVLQVDSLREGPGLVLRGPGIRGEARVQARPLADDMAGRLAVNRRLFPRGVDILLATVTAMAALPRSVHVEQRGD